MHISIRSWTDVLDLMKLNTSNFYNYIFSQDLEFYGRILTVLGAKFHKVKVRVVSRKARCIKAWASVWSCINLFQAICAMRHEKLEYISQKVLVGFYIQRTLIYRFCITISCPFSYAPIRIRQWSFDFTMLFLLHMYTPSHSYSNYTLIFKKH